MNVCPNILGITSGTTAITIFSFSSVIEGYSYTFASAIDGMFMPKIARITYQEKNMDKILNLMIKVGRFQYHLVGMIVIGFICVGKDFILLWIGADYISVYYCAILLLLPAPFYLSQQIAKNTMVMVNKIRYLTIVNVIKAGLNVLLVSLLSIKWGSLGACLSISIVYFFRNFANMYLYKTKLGINTKTFYLKCYGKMSIVMLITLGMGLLLNSIANSLSWIILGGKIICIIFIYLILMWLLAYSDEEKNIVTNIYKKVLRK